MMAPITGHPPTNAEEAQAAVDLPLPRRRQDSNDRALLVAARHGMTTHVQHLLRRGANVNVRDATEQKTPLLLAAEKDRTDLVQVLVQQHANVHDTCPLGMTALHYAAWQGNEPMLRILLQAGANVNALNSSQETALHGAAHFAYVDVVQTLVLDYQADTNVASRAQHIPLQEVQLRNDKRSARKAIVELLQQTSPETLYSVLFAGCDDDNDDDDGNMDQWLGRMLRAVKSLPTCKIFYTIVKAAAKLELLTPAPAQQQVQEWIERAFEHVMHRCTSPDDLTILGAMVDHAVEEGDLSKAMADVLQQYCQQVDPSGSIGSHDSAFWNMRRTIRREIISFRPLGGVDGKTASIRQCLKFWKGAVAEMARGGHHNSAAAKRKALIGVMGALLNAILAGNRNTTNGLHNPFFDQFASQFTDFLNFEHMTRIIENDGDWRLRRTSAVDEFNRGRDNCETLLHQLGDSSSSSSSSAWLENGFIVLGVCSAIVPPREMTGVQQEMQPPNPPNPPNYTGRAAPTPVAPSLLHQRRHRPQDERLRRDEQQQPQQFPDNDSLQTASTTGAPFSPGSEHSTAPSTNTGGTSLIESANPDKATNLHWAIVEGRKDKLQAELERISRLDASPINELDSRHRTPLDLAALSGQKEMFNLIKASGGERNYFGTDQEMRAVMDYCSKDTRGNRIGLLRTYIGSTRSSIRSTNSSLESTSTGGGSIRRPQVSARRNPMQAIYPAR